MKHLAITLCTACLLAAGIARSAESQQPTPSSLPRAEISEASVRAHMEFLASDALNGRKSGSRDEWITATYIASQMRRLGIEPMGDDGGYVQDVRMERSDIAAPPVLTAGDFTGTHGMGITVAGLTGATISGPLQVHRAGTPVAAGAALLVAGGVTLSAADAARVALLLAPESTAARGGRVGGRAGGRGFAVQSMSGVAPRATVTLGAEAYTALQAIPAGTPVSLRAETSGTPVVTHTWNAMGKITGSSPELAGEVILLSAHLDHLGVRAAPPVAQPAAGATATAPAAPADLIFNGADDDASGSIAVLELAEALAKGPRPARTVIFVWFGSEEAGGFGARHFIDAPPVPLDRIVANLEFEMIGRPDPMVPAGTLWLTGYERSDLGAVLAEHGAKIVADPHPEQNFFSRSDNIQLARRGVIAQTVSSFGLHTDYHRVSDETKTIDFPHMTAAIRSMLEPIRWLANESFKPQWKEGMKP